MASIFVAEGRISFHYKIVLNSGRSFILHSEPVQPRVGSEIYGNINDTYTIVYFASPPSLPFPLLQGIQVDPQYAQRHLGIDVERASLLSAISSTLTLNSPADMILEAVEVWEKGGRK